MYALKIKGKFQFSCLAGNKESSDEKIKTAFNNWRGCQSKGSNKSFDDFMFDKERVKVTIERI